MCGISGIINFSNEDENLKEEIRLINNTIKHRGPDGEGFVFINNDEHIPAAGNETSPDILKGDLAYTPKKNIDEISEKHNLVFGHRRLSIIDLGPTGHQPMCTSDKKIWITYNGEIYNYLELKKILQDLGYKFYTTSDTEVILNSYLHWGKECLKYFNGMWALAIYDSHSKEVFISRDRFGVKPLYYYKDGNHFVFASEIKALVKSKLVKTEINPSAVFDYFVKGELELEEEGVFKNILELFPSYALLINTQNGDIKKWKYYSLPVNSEFESFDNKRFEEIKEKTKELLVNSISLRLRSDVPVGSCLSGGIDSSVIVGIIHDLLKKENNINVGEKLKVFTATFPQKEYDESQWAAMMVERTKAEWHKVTPTADELIRDIESLVYSQDEPIWSTSTYAQYRVMQKVKESGIKVVLDGQGGDELFGGYNTQLPSFWLELLKNGKIRNAVGEINNSEGFSFFVKQYLRQNLFPASPASIQKQFTKQFYSDIKYLNRDFWEAYKHRIGSGNSERKNNLNQKLYSEFYNARLKVYLKCEDRCSMWHSVESRTPFADDIKLIEYIFSLPSVYKIHNGINKYLLREASADFIPSEIKSRTDKMGYVTPNNKWINEISGSFRDIHDQKQNDFLNTGLLKKDFNTFFDPPAGPENGRIFKYLCFPIWRNVFNI